VQLHSERTNDLKKCVTRHYPRKKKKTTTAPVSCVWDRQNRCFIEDRTLTFNVWNTGSSRGRSETQKHRDESIEKRFSGSAGIDYGHLQQKVWRALSEAHLLGPSQSTARAVLARGERSGGRGFTPGKVGKGHVGREDAKNFGGPCLRFFSSKVSNSSTEQLILQKH